MIKRFKTAVTRPIALGLAGGLVCSLLSGCGDQSLAEGQILTQKRIEDGRTPITVMVKYAFTINSFEKAVEEKFPNIDIIQVGNFTYDRGIEEYEKRLIHDDLTDIVMTWPLEVGEEYWADRLMDLSSFDFTNRYNLSVLDTISRDGALYYLPGPSQVRGLVYNKTLFEEKGWTVPADFEEFVELCHTIEESGIRPLQLGLGNEEVLDTAFVGYGFADCYSRPQDMQWIAGYNNGQGSFGDHFMPALNTFQRLIDQGILKAKDLDITYATRETMLFTRQCAMVEDSVLLAKMGYDATGTLDEFGLMPFFNPDDGGDWARLYMVCYIGLNKHLAEEKNKDKMELVLQLMEYISSPEGQEALMGDTGGMFSSLRDMPASDVVELVDVRSALQKGRYAIFPELKNAQGALRRGLAGMVAGELVAADVVKMVDEENLNPPKKTTPTALSMAKESFSLIETGEFVCDVIRKESDSDIALFLDNGKDGRYNGKGISGRLYEGYITANDIMRILPDLKDSENSVLCFATMTGENIIQTLEHAITINNGAKGWFYYFSGLKVSYNPVAEAGSRISKITTADGKELVKDQLYRVVSIDSSLPTDYCQSYEVSDRLVSKVLEEYMSKQEFIAPEKDGRFTIIS